jgi:hypothetical protein
MKKTLCTLLAAAALLAGVEAQAQMSVGAGYLNITQSFDNTSANGNGAYAGLSFNIPLAGGFGIAPGVYYTFSNYKQDAAWGLLKGSTTEHAINVPLNLNFGYNLARDMRAFIFGGPTFQYGLSSKTKTDVAGAATVNDDNYSDDGTQRFVVYAGGGLGMDIANKFQVTVGYDHSVTNMIKSDSHKVGRGLLKIGAAMLF